MNKKAQSGWLYLIVGVILVLLAVWYFGGAEMKQKPQPADISDEKEGTPYVRMRDEEGNEGDMLEDFYKVLGVVGSMVRGTTSVSCSIDSDCTAKCGGDSFCLNHIQCYQDQCTYGPGASGVPITQIALDARASNTGATDLDVTFDSVTSGVAGSVFEVSHNANVGTTVQVNAGQTHTFIGEFFNLAPYEGATTTFIVGLHAVDLYSAERFPAVGTLDSSVSLVVSVDPTGGFSVQISQLPGI